MIWPSGASNNQNNDENYVRWVWIANVGIFDIAVRRVSLSVIIEALITGITHVLN